MLLGGSFPPATIFLDFGRHDCSRTFELRVFTQRKEVAFELVCAKIQPEMGICEKMIERGPTDRDVLGRESVLLGLAPAEPLL